MSTGVRLHDTALNPHSLTKTRTIVGLDIREAFENVSHHAILKKLEETKPGTRIYNYVRDFLTIRTLGIQVDEYTSPIHALHKGVPQRAILSPLLFNLAIKDLPTQLQHIEDLEYNIYADDVTVWCTKGSTVDQEETLQNATEIVQKYTQQIGLMCSPEKSEFIVILSNTRKKAEECRNQIQLYLDNYPIPRKLNIKILGYIIREDGKADN